MGNFPQAGLNFFHLRGPTFVLYCVRSNSFQCYFEKGTSASPVLSPRHHGQWSWWCIYTTICLSFGARSENDVTKQTPSYSCSAISSTQIRMSPNLYFPPKLIRDKHVCSKHHFSSPVLTYSQVERTVGPSVVSILEPFLGLVACLVLGHLHNWIVESSDLQHNARGAIIKFRFIHAFF
jgi:hypothetical protein